MTRKQFITEVENRFTNCKVSKYYEVHDTDFKDIKGITNQYAVVFDYDIFDPVKALRNEPQACYYAVWTIDGKLQKNLHPLPYLRAIDFIKDVMF